MNHLFLVVLKQPSSTDKHVSCWFPRSFSKTTGKRPTAGKIRAVTMVATSTLKTKSSECISELVERRYDQVCIEKGELTGVFSSSLCV